MHENQPRVHEVESILGRRIDADVVAANRIAGVGVRVAAAIYGVRLIRRRVRTGSWRQFPGGTRHWAEFPGRF